MNLLLLVPQPLNSTEEWLLHSLMSQAGIDADETQIKAIFPAELDPRHCAPSNAEPWLAKCEDLVRRLRPNLVVAFGNAASYATTSQWPTTVGDLRGANGIEERRGYLWVGRGGGKVLSTLEPKQALVRYDPSGINAMLLLKDLERAKNESKTAELDRSRYKITVVNSRNSGDILHSLCAVSNLVCDIECFNEATTACIGFAPNSHEAFVFPPQHFKAAHKLLLDKSIAKIFANGQFDLYHLLSRDSIRVAGSIEDVFVQWHCFAGYQEIDTLQGKVAIASLVGKKDVWIWGYKNGKFIPTKMEACVKTKTHQLLVKVSVLERGKLGNTRNFPSGAKDYDIKEIACTPDHKFLQLDGSWVEAQHLKTGDGLRHVKIHWGERPKININKQQPPIGRLVWEHINGPISKGNEIHHIDEDPTNNHPSNLVCLTKGEHNIVHGKHKHLDQTGVPNALKHVWAGVKIDPQEVIQLYRAGLSCKEVAMHYNTHYGVVYQLLLRFEEPRRTQSEAQQLRRSKEHNARVLKVEWLNELEDVYCMSVPETNNFLIHGCVVHNCLWPEIAGQREGKGSKRTHKSLSFLQSIYGASPEYWKDYNYLNDGEMYELNGKDCCITFDLWEKMNAEIDAVGVRGIYEHERKLIWPVVEIQHRGLLVDEEARAKALSALENDEERLSRGLASLIEPLLLERRELIERPNLFWKTVSCKCCGNGKKKRERCWSCAGFEKAPSKKAWIKWFDDDPQNYGSYEKAVDKVDTLADLNEQFLGSCDECKGVGQWEEFYYNPGSNDQTKEILYNVLKLPPRMKKGSLSSDEEALKSLLGGMG